MLNNHSSEHMRSERLRSVRFLFAVIIAVFLLAAACMILFFIRRDTPGKAVRSTLNQISSMEDPAISQIVLPESGSGISEKAIAGLADGRYDVLVAQFPMTAGDTSRFAFTDPIYIDQQVLVQRRNSQAIHSQLDLAGDTVWVVKGSPMIQRIASLSREIGDTIYVHVDELYGPEQLMMMVSGGEIRYAVVNRSIARAMSSRLPNLDRSVAISLSQFQSWMVAKNRHGLCDSLNAWHNQVKLDTAAYLGLQRRYFGGTFPTLAR